MDIPDGIYATFETLKLDDVVDPEVHVILEYWQRLRGDRFAPSWPVFNWSDIPYHCIPKFTVVDVSTEPLDFTYRFWGTSLADGQKQEMTGRSVRELKPLAEAEAIFSQYANLHTTREPTVFQSSVSGWMAEDLVGLSLRMPFSEDGETISQIVSYNNYEQAYKSLKSSLENPWNWLDPD